LLDKANDYWWMVGWYRFPPKYNNNAEIEACLSNYILIILFRSHSYRSTKSSN